MSAVSPYCTRQDVIATLPKVLGSVASPNSLISPTTIDGLCITISAEMDSRFNLAGYTVPILTGRNVRIQQWLKRIAVNGVCASVLISIYNTGEVNFQLGETYREQYYRDITLIENKGFGSDGPTPTTLTAGPIGVPLAGPVREPTFKIGERIV